MPESEALIDYWQLNEETEQDSLVSLKLLTRNTRLVEARHSKGVTQAQMAHEIEMSLSKLSRIENLHFLPTDADQAKIATYLSQPIDSLFPGVLMRAIEKGVFERRDAQLAEPEIISLTEAQQLQLAYDGEGNIIDEVSRHLLQEEIKKTLDTLKPREAEIIRLRFGLDEDGHSRTLQEIADIIGLSRAQIQQIEAKALRKLRYPLRSRQLKDYLE